MSCERTIKALPGPIYAAWTHRMDIWFAQAGTLNMSGKPGQAFFFYNRNEWGRHPHYGRILESKKNRLIEMTWVTGNGKDEGTAGAETILRIDLVPCGDATQVRLTHSGFVSQTSRDAHEENWPLALEILDEALS